MRITPMNGAIRRCLPTWVKGITLPPFGIYLRPDRLTDAHLIAHETAHWAQYERMGALRYYGTYLYQRVRYGYANHPMEIEARAQARVHTGGA